MAALSFLGPDGCALVELYDEDPDECAIWIVTPLKLVAGPSHWEKRAIELRESCNVCGRWKYSDTACLFIGCPRQREAA